MNRVWSASGLVGESFCFVEMGQWQSFEDGKLRRNGRNEKRQENEAGESLSLRADLRRERE